MRLPDRLGKGVETLLRRTSPAREVPPTIQSVSIQSVSNSAISAAVDGGRGPSLSLSARERQVLELAAEGLTNAQIGSRLQVTGHAVKFHLASVYRKLGVTNRTEAAVLFSRGSRGLDQADSR